MKISRKFVMELNSVLDNFCGDCQINFTNCKFIGVVLYNATLEVPNLFRQSDVLLILPNTFPAIFSAYTVVIEYAI